MKKRKKIVKGIISYILALALTIFFALYMNATVGWFMFVALILALVLSVFFAFLVMGSVEVTCDMEDCILAKGDCCDMTITVMNKSLFPTTPIEIEILNGEGVKCTERSVLVTVLPFEKQTFNVSFKAKICGPSTVGIKSVKVTDYLGLIAFKAKRKTYDKLRYKVAVIPDIADVSPRNDKILKVMQASLHADDSDDTVEVSSNTFGGFPGCDNREYIPGDPLKRVNWKQSAKRGKLLVRLDDVLASRTVNLVLDSVYIKEKTDVRTLSGSSVYQGTDKEDIPAKIAEDAVETALGIIKTLVLSNYKVNFFLSKAGGFALYEMEDEKDIEAMRLQLAEYAFDTQLEKERIPKDDVLDKYSSFVFCTPNDYKDVFAALKEGEDASRMSVFSVIGDAKEKVIEETVITVNKATKKENTSKQNIKSLLNNMIVPYLLALISSVTLFKVFNVPVLSVWTLVQVLWCAGLFALCQYARRHKVIGTAVISIVIIGAFFFFSKVAFSGIEYMQWFMSGADTIENTTGYLMTLLLIFTTLFAMVLFYYTQVYYRTSAIMLVTIIPYVVYVKVIREVSIVLVMLAIVLNVSTFLINTRKQRDKNKRIIGYKRGLLSVILYAVCFVMLAFAVPKSEETKYYHFFEEWFLGGNTTVPIPEEYGDQNEFSGNADNFNQLTNRQIYNVYNADLTEPLYLRRQVFDYYDFEYDRWYGDEEYSKYRSLVSDQNIGKQYLDNATLLQLFLKAEECSPGFLEKYGMEHLKEAVYESPVTTATVSARNFTSYYLLTPTKTLNVSIRVFENVYKTDHGIYGNEFQPFSRNVSYDVAYISEFQVKRDWISLGGSNIDYETSEEMITEMATIISECEDIEEWQQEAAVAFLNDVQFAGEYAAACSKNNEQIAQKVKELALEITKDCTYEWEKAQALENYFRTSGFTYDLEYDAPDDSVEYFLFEGKTGTCSDFASAYVLMARAAGLTVRYVEGFVPSREVSATYELQYVVRTKNSHAYPEVYIPNIGFVVYEPTVGGFGEMDGNQNKGLMAYIMVLAMRIIAVFAVIAFVVAVILLIARVIAPTFTEKRFLSKVKKADESTAVIMLYKRLLEKYAIRYIKVPLVNTPYEFAHKFEELFGEDISPLTYLVEKAAYARETVNSQDKADASKVYHKAKKAVKEYKRKKK